MVRGRVGSAPDLLKENSRPRLAVTPKTSRLEKMRVQGRKKMRGRERPMRGSFPIPPPSDFLRLPVHREFDVFFSSSSSLCLSFIYNLILGNFVILCRYLDWD